MAKLEEFPILEDIKMIKQTKKLSNATIATILGIGEATLYRYLKDPQSISQENLNKIYDFAYTNGLRLNTIKSNFFEEEYKNKGCLVMYHGSEEGMFGNKVDLKYSSDNNDFGIGFYCGDAMVQPETFVINYEKSSLYMFAFNPSKLKKLEFKVDTEWVLAIAYYRGYLEKYKNNLKVKKIIDNINEADYIVAPIADNTMFDIIKKFTRGEISDVQCQHSLSATNLGKQYVFKTQKAINSLIFLNKCFISKAERKDLTKTLTDNRLIGEDKVNIAMNKYRTDGVLIGKLLNEE